MNENRQWIIFDLGNVLVKLNQQADATLLNRLPEDSQRALRELLRDNFQRDSSFFSLGESFQLGRLSTDEFINKIHQATGPSVTPEQIVGDIESKLAGESEEMVALLPELDAQYQLACYSNTHAIHWDYMVRNYRFMDFLHPERRVASHLIGMAKPEPAAFLRCCEVLGVAPQRCILVDDLERNVDGAREAGMQAIHFTTPAAFRERLRDGRLLV